MLRLLSFIILLTTVGDWVKRVKIKWRLAGWHNNVTSSHWGRILSEVAFKYFFFVRVARV